MATTKTKTPTLTASQIYARRRQQVQASQSAQAHKLTSHGAVIRRSVPAVTYDR